MAMFITSIPVTKSSSFIEQFQGSGRLRRIQKLNVIAGFKNLRTKRCTKRFTVKPDSLNLEYATHNQGKRRIQVKIEYTIDSKSVVFRVFILG
jgi:hypothetical protein